MSTGIYDDPSTEIMVNPNFILEWVNVASSMGSVIVDNIETIGNTLAALHLSWVGSSSADAYLYSYQWTNMITSLFGTPGNANSGVFNQMLTAAYTAANNYAYAEGGVAQMFNGLADGLAHPVPGLTGGGDPTNAPITETAIIPRH